MLSNQEASRFGDARQRATRITGKLGIERCFLNIYVVAVETILSTTNQPSTSALQDGVSILSNGISNFKTFAKPVFLLIDATLSRAVKKSFKN